MATRPIRLDRDLVVRWWLHRQGLSQPRGTAKLSPDTLTAHLEATGGLQLDSVNVLDRAHYLTLWSRFGCYDHEQLDRWIYEQRLGFDYWAHEASILPASHLPLARYRMRTFPNQRMKAKSYWPRMKTSSASKRRVLRRLAQEGPLESVDFKADSNVVAVKGDGWSSKAAKEDSRSLGLLWHAGQTAVHCRRHFRRVYDLADRIYQPVSANAPSVDKRTYDDSWLLRGLSGCGVASEAHLHNYITGPNLLAGERLRVLRRNLKAGAIVEVVVDDVPGTCYARASDLDEIGNAPKPVGTTLICPFDSLLWQRKRAQQLLDFTYTVEIYVPAAKRKFGYYALPILHNGRLVGRLDPKFHRDRGDLEIHAIYLERAAERTQSLEQGLSAAIEDLAKFVGAVSVTLPKGWRQLL